VGPSLEAAASEVVTHCPQPRRPFLPLFDPSVPGTSSQSPITGTCDLSELLGLDGAGLHPMEKSDIKAQDPSIAENRPLSSLSTNGGQTPSPDEVTPTFASSWLGSLRSNSPQSLNDESWPGGDAFSVGLEPWSLRKDDLPIGIEPMSQFGCTVPCPGTGVSLSGAFGAPFGPRYVDEDLQFHGSAVASSSGNPVGGKNAPGPRMGLLAGEDSPVGSLQCTFKRPEMQVGRIVPEPASPLQGPGIPATASIPGDSTAKVAASKNSKNQKRTRRGGKCPPVTQSREQVKESDTKTLTKEAVLQMSTTQAGSKLLQRKLLKGHPTIIKDILNGIEMDLPALMCNMYGNYLCSAAFQACSVAQRQRMLAIASSHLKAVATDKWGTHALQALISLVCTLDEQRLLMGALKDLVVELSCDSNGVHVVQRALTSFGQPVSDLVASEVIKCLGVVAHDPHGLCVLKKCISQCRTTQNQQMLLSEMAKQALDLVQGPYANYAVQHVLEEWGGDFCEPIMQALKGKLVQLSIQKFSSNVVEMVLRVAPKHLQSQLLDELTLQEQAVVLTSTVYGLYVARQVLQHASQFQRAAFERLAARGLADLRDRRLRSRWERLLQGEAEQDGNLFADGANDSLHQLTSPSYELNTPQSRGHSVQSAAAVWLGNPGSTWNAQHEGTTWATCSI